MKNFFAGKRSDQNIGGIVRLLVIIAAGVTLTGGIVYLLRTGGASPGYGSFKGEPQTLKSIGAIVGNAASLHPRAIIQLGVLMLIGIPILRVAIFLISFLFKRDFLYTAISLIVLLILLFSLLHGTI